VAGWGGYATHQLKSEASLYCSVYNRCWYCYLYVGMMIVGMMSMEDYLDINFIGDVCVLSNIQLLLICFGDAFLAFFSSKDFILEMVSVRHTNF
jgi:hypothetical protein